MATKRKSPYRSLLDITSKILIVSDLQCPYVDWPVWGAVLDFARDLQPDMVILNGDIHDFYSLSTYSQDPARKIELSAEIKTLQKYVLTPLSRLTGTMIWTEGNHEQRLQRYLWTKAPELSKLESLQIESLFNMGDYGIKYEKDKVNVGKHLVVTHGHLWSMHSAYTAKRHWERYGSSMVIGHSHRMGTFCVTDLGGVHEVVEAGCLCDLKPEWTKFPNWQQGFAVVNLFSDGTFNTTPVKIVNRSYFMWGSEVYKVMG